VFHGRRNVSKTTTSSKTLRPITPTAVEAAARADRDAQPLTAGDLKRMKANSAGKNHSPRFGVDAGGIRLPLPHPPRHSPGLGARPRATDRPTQAYLKIIAREPERLERLFNRRTL